MTDELTPDQMAQRMKALEGLLHHYLTDDRHGANKEMVIAVSDNNQARVTFITPPTKDEVNFLISHLRSVIKVTPETRTRVTLKTVNDILSDAGLPEIGPSK